MPKSKWTEAWCLSSFRFWHFKWCMSVHRSVLWCCWLGGRKGIWREKNWVVCCAGVVICADLHTAQLILLPLTVSYFIKISGVVVIFYLWKRIQGEPSLSPSFPSLPLGSRYPSSQLRLGGLGERSSSPSGSGRSPAAKRILTHFWPKFAPFWVSNTALFF